MRNYSRNRITFEELFRHTLDCQTAGKPASKIDFERAKEAVQNGMLEVIRTHNLEDVLVCNLQLYSLHHAMRNER